MESGTLFILLVIAVALAFDFINGFHDAANSIATIVTTGVLTPRQAVIWAAFFNFIAFLIFDVMVAKTVGSGLIDLSVIDVNLIFSALLGAIAWNLLTWYFGIPSSSSHALIGGLAGAALVKTGLAALKYQGFLKVALGIIFSPLLGFAIGLLLVFFFSTINSLFKDKPYLELFHKGLQLSSSALLSITHGSNDAQKTMGIIAALLFAQGYLGNKFYIPFWLVICCQAVISLGTLFGGWRIVRTMGTKITKLNTLNASAAETGAALVIYLATEGGVPVSTTYTVTGSITGVGVFKSELHDGYAAVLKKIWLSWLLTIPAAGGLAALIMMILLFFS